MQYKYVEFSYSTLKHNFTSVYPLSAILYFILDNFSHLQIQIEDPQNVIFY